MIKYNAKLPGSMNKLHFSHVAGFQVLKQNLFELQPFIPIVGGLKHLFIIPAVDSLGGVPHR